MKLIGRIIIIIIVLFEIIMILYIKYVFFEILNGKSINNIFQNKNQLKIFEKKIREEFSLKKHANLNEIEANLPFGRKWEKNKYGYNEVNVGSSLDPNFILKTIITTTSVIDSQKSTTKLRLHFSVVNNFKPKDMIKIYSLRYSLREDVEFNFYDASRVERDLISISRKGPGLAAKLLLPQLVEDNVKRLILIDNGDVLVLRDLSEMYNWDMKNNIYMGSPDIAVGVFGKISNQILKVYINVGHYLIDIQKVKEKNMYNLFLKNKYVYKTIWAEQLMLNDIANGEIGYLPVEFGLAQPFGDDKLFYKRKSKSTVYKQYNTTMMSKESNFLPKTYEEFLHHAYDPVIFHSWCGKLSDGKGMNIYRKLFQYFIELSGMKKEICLKHPGYCIKK